MPFFRGFAKIRRYKLGHWKLDFICAAISNSRLLDAALTADGATLLLEGTRREDDMQRLQVEGIRVYEREDTLGIGLVHNVREVLSVRTGVE